MFLNFSVFLILICHLLQKVPSKNSKNTENYFSSSITSWAVFPKAKQVSPYNPKITFLSILTATLILFPNKSYHAITYRSPIHNDQRKKRNQKVLQQMTVWEPTQTSRVVIGTRHSGSLL